MRTVFSKGAKYFLDKKIGSGKFSQVFSANSSNSNSLFAVKIIPKRFVNIPEAKQTLYNEFQIHSSVHHNNIIDCIDSFEDSENFYLITDFFNGETLLERVRRSGPLSEALGKRIAYQITSAITYLHRLGISHQNLSPDNILISKQDQIKIIDFGFSIKDYHGKANSTCEFFGFPPESGIGKSYDPPLIDSWQLGYTLFYIFSGIFPWNGTPVLRITSTFLDMPSTIPKAACQIIQFLLQIDPLRRYSVEQAGANYWVKSKPRSHLCKFSSLTLPKQVTSLPGKEVVKRTASLKTDFNETHSDDIDFSLLLDGTSIVSHSHSRRSNISPQFSFGDKQLFPIDA